MTIHPLAVLAIIAGIVWAARAALWYAESREPSNYERDEIPPPERTVSPQDWMRLTLTPGMCCACFGTGVDEWHRPCASCNGSGDAGRSKR